MTMRHTAPSMKLDLLKVQAQTLCRQGKQKVRQVFRLENEEDTAHCSQLTLLSQKAGFLPAGVLENVTMNIRQTELFEAIFHDFDQLEDLFRMVIESEDS